MLRTLSRIAGLALLAAALLGGCGGGSESTDRFKSDFRSVNDQLLTLGSSVGQALQNAPKTSDPMLAGEFDGFGTQLVEIKRRLDALHPPDDLKPQVEAVSAAAAKLIADVRAIAHAAKVHDGQAAREATQGLLRDSQTIGDARRALARKTGARVGP